METIMQKLPMSNRQRQIYEACLKMQQGEKLFTEGTIELAHLTREKSANKGHQTGGRDVTGKVKDILESKKPKKVVANKVSRKIIKVSPERINEVAQDILGLAKKDEWLTTHAVMKSLKVGHPLAKKALLNLKKNGKLKVVKKPNPNSHMPTLARDYWSPA